MSDPRNVWKNLETKGKVMSAAEVRIKAEKMAADIRRDTTIAIVLACAITVFAGVGILQQHATPPRIISGVAVLVVWFGMWRTIVHRRIRLSEADSASCVEFCRNELRRRRDYFAKTPWGLIFAIGFASILFGAWRFPAALLVLGLIVFPFWRHEVRKFQRELDELDKFDPPSSRLP